MSNVFLPPSQTRLVTIAAHVDHGKTSLADNLIEYNGIISERLAGTMRYLDSDPEEQRRGITMKSSAIGLKHTYITKQSSSDMVIHLVDSPGHTDFCAEVSVSVQFTFLILNILISVSSISTYSQRLLHVIQRF